VVDDRPVRPAESCIRALVSLAVLVTLADLVITAVLAMLGSLGHGLRLRFHIGLHNDGQSFVASVRLYDEAPPECTAAMHHHITPTRMVAGISCWYKLLV